MKHIGLIVAVIVAYFIGASFPGIANSIKSKL